jgi:hypothetical protein
MFIYVAFTQFRGNGDEIIHSVFVRSMDPHRDRIPIESGKDEMDPNEEEEEEKDEKRNSTFRMYNFTHTRYVAYAYTIECTLYSSESRFIHSLEIPESYRY